MVPRGLEPRTLRLLAVYYNQLSYDTNCVYHYFVLWVLCVYYGCALALPSLAPTLLLNVEARKERLHAIPWLALWPNG